MSGKGRCQGLHLEVRWPQPGSIRYWLSRKESNLLVSCPCRKKNRADYRMTELDQVLKTKSIQVIPMLRAQLCSLVNRVCGNKTEVLSQLNYSYQVPFAKERSILINRIKDMLSWRSKFLRGILAQWKKGKCSNQAQGTSESELSGLPPLAVGPQRWLGGEYRQCPPSWCLKQRCSELP